MKNLAGMVRKLHACVWNLNCAYTRTALLLPEIPMERAAESVEEENDQIVGGGIVSAKLYSYMASIICFNLSVFKRYADGEAWT